METTTPTTIIAAATNNSNINNSPTLPWKNTAHTHLTVVPANYIYIIILEVLGLV